MESRLYSGTLSLYRKTNHPRQHVQQEEPAIDKQYHGMCLLSELGEVALLVADPTQWNSNRNLETQEN